MAAEFEDALLGYKFYLERRGKVSLDEVNDYLLDINRRPIQLRTYTHYQRLFANGVPSYVSINRFDVLQSLGRSGEAADRRRYHREAATEEIKISRNRTSWSDATIINRSLVGFGIVARRFPISTGATIWIRREGSRDIPVRVAWKEHDGSLTIVGVKAPEYLVGYLLPESDEEHVFPTGHLVVSRTDEGEINWDILYSILIETNNLIKTVQDLIFTVAKLNNTEVRLTRTKVESIKFGSPGALDLITPEIVVSILAIILDFASTNVLQRKKHVEEIRKIMQETVGQSHDNRKRKIDADNYSTQVSQETTLRDLEVDNKMLDLWFRQLQLAEDLGDSAFRDEVAEAIKNDMREKLNIGEMSPEAFSPGSIERNMLENQIIPTVHRLTTGVDPNFDITVSTEGEL